MQNVGFIFDVLQVRLKKFQKFENLQILGINFDTRHINAYYNMQNAIIYRPVT